MNNLKKFATEADYNAATLNYPAVSWVTGTDVVHFDKTAPVVANNKVKIAFTADACSGGKTFGLIDSTALSSLNGITVNGEPFTTGDSDIYLPLVANTDYLIEYELKDGVTDVDNWFALSPTQGCASININYDLLFPSQVNEINSLNNSINNMILETETPPTVTFVDSDISNIVGIYVPDSAVNAYKSASVWESFSSKIFPISDYEGDIPV